MLGVFLFWSFYKILKRLARFLRYLVYISKIIDFPSMNFGTKLPPKAQLYFEDCVDISSPE